MSIYVIDTHIYVTYFYDFDNKPTKQLSTVSFSNGGFVIGVKVLCQFVAGEKCYYCQLRKNLLN
jgi:hypothetical protein